MALLPNPFNSAASDAAAEQAAASLLSQAPSDAVADLSDSCVFTVTALDEAAAPLRQDDGAAVEYVDLDQTDCIGEIFVGARKLEQLPGIFDQAAITPADELLYATLKATDDPWAADLIDVPAGMWLEFDAPPLFLQQASGF